MENNTFKQLMLSEATEILTVEQRDFVETHKQIISCGTMAGRYFVELARKLKHMNDTKLYVTGGFESFAEYVEEAVGIKYRQARNYIRVAETFTDAYLEEHAGAGVTKLTLLAQVNESVREEIEESIDINTASTDEVKDAVAAVIRERDEAHKQLSLMDGQLAEKNEELSESEAAREALQKAYENKKKELEEAKKQADDLKKNKADLEKKLKAAKDVAKEVKTVPDEKSKKEAEEQRKRADELASKLRETSAQLAAAQAQKKTIATNELILFKSKYEDLQRIGDEIVWLFRTMDVENAFKCRKALNAIIDEWKEEMGL